jgi:hypothetical protein
MGLWYRYGTKRPLTYGIGGRDRVDTAYEDHRILTLPCSGIGKWPMRRADLRSRSVATSNTAKVALAATQDMLKAEMGRRPFGRMFV